MGGLRIHRYIRVGVCDLGQKLSMFYSSIAIGMSCNERPYSYI